MTTAMNRLVAAADEKRMVLNLQTNEKQGGCNSAVRPYILGSVPHS